MAKSTKTMDQLLRRLPCSPATLVVVAVGVVALLAAVFVFSRPDARAEDPDPSPVATEELSAMPVSDAARTRSAPDPYEVATAARSALDAASGTDEVNLFYAQTGIQRTLDATEESAIDAAIAAFHDAGADVGFVMYDLVTQRGIGYNADKTFFSASTVKAPFVAYLLQDVIDGDQASFDDEIVEDYVVSGTGVMASDDTDVYSLETVLENTIVHSDNTGYALLREQFGEDGFAAWCATADADEASWEGGWYPYYTARDLAKLWLNIGAYVAEDQEDAAWVKSLFLQTNSSFLREALGRDCAVLSKPGYEINAPGEDIGALNDAGVILVDGGVYVIAIMSNADYDDEYFMDNQYLIVDLATALGAAHDQLLVEQEAA